MSHKGGSVLVGKPNKVKQSSKTTIHGTSEKLHPHSADCVASAEFMPFAPYPCVCLVCLAAKAQKKRVYARVYENKLETNNCPCAPLLCCTTEGCVSDSIYTAYYSHPPFRVGMCPRPCCMIPCLCCGPPVIFIRRPTTCCCIDCRPCCGETIFASPSNCFDLKCCLCCGAPCHMIFCASPLVLNVRNGRLFLSKLKATTQEYHAENGYLMPGQAGQNVVYREVIDRGDCCYGLCSSTRDVEAWSGEPLKAPLSESMERTGGEAVYTEAAPVNDGNVVMAAAAVPVAVSGGNKNNQRHASFDSDDGGDDNSKSTQKSNNPYENNDYDDDAFDEMAKRYQPPPPQEEKVAKGRESHSSSAKREKGHHRSSSRSRSKNRAQPEEKQLPNTSHSRPVERQEDDEELVRRSYTSQLSGPPQKRTSFDTWGGSSDSFADSAHFDESMFKNAALDSSALENSGPFGESSTMGIGSGLASGGTGASSKPKKRKKKKKSNGDRHHHSNKPKEDGDRESRRPRQGADRESSRPRQGTSKERSSSRPRNGGERKSSHRRDGGGHRASSRQREDKRVSNQREDPEKKKRRKKKSTKPRPAHYSSGIGINEMERE